MTGHVQNQLRYKILSEDFFNLISNISNIWKHIEHKIFVMCSNMLKCFEIIALEMAFIWTLVLSNIDKYQQRIQGADLNNG